MLGGIADIRRNHSDAVVSQYDISSMVEIYATPPRGATSARFPPISARSSPENDKDKPKGAIVRPGRPNRDHV